MTDKNIVLIGFMGAGKSLVSKVLGKRLGRKIYSTDELIEQKQSKTISQIFEDSGEPAFRAMETEAVSGLSGINDAIVDCGGGIVLNPENLKSLKKNGVVIYLSATAQTIFDNIKEKGHRPLLNNEDPMAKIEELLQQRTPLYEQADITVQTDGKSIEQLAEEIAEKFENE